MKIWDGQDEVSDCKTSKESTIMGMKWNHLKWVGELGKVDSLTRVITL